MKARRPRLASLAWRAACCGLLLWSPSAPADPQAPMPVAAAPPASAPAKAAAETAVDTQLPAFQPGLWEYRRTLMRGGKPQVSTTRKCADPGTDMREKMAQLRKKNCQFAPLKRSKEHYISSWICQTPTGAMRFRDVLTATDDSSYQDVSETHTAQHISQQKLEARRLGECPGLGAGAPLRPTKPPPRHP